MRSTLSSQEMSRDNLTLSIQIFTLKEREAKNSNSNSGLIQLPISTIIPYTGTQMQLCKLTHCLLPTIILLNHHKISQISCTGILQIIHKYSAHLNLTFRNHLQRDLRKRLTSHWILLCYEYVSATQSYLSTENPKANICLISNISFTSTIFTKNTYFFCKSSSYSNQCLLENLHLLLSNANNWFERFVNLKIGNIISGGTLIVCQSEFSVTMRTRGLLTQTSKE